MLNKQPQSLKSSLSSGVLQHEEGQHLLPLQQPVKLPQPRLGRVISRNKEIIQPLWPHLLSRSLISLLTKAPISAKCGGGFCKASTWELSPAGERWWPWDCIRTRYPLALAGEGVRGDFWGKPHCGGGCREIFNCRHFPPVRYRAPTLWLCPRHFISDKNQAQSTLLSQRVP